MQNTNHPAARLIAALVLATAAGGLHAQGDPGMTSRGQPTRIERDSAYGRVVATVYEGRFSYVRIESREPGSTPNQHPVAIDPVALRGLLARIQLPGSKNEALFNKEELDEIVPPLAQALARATPEQDVSFAISGQHGLMGPLALRVVTTARLFWSDGSMNLIVGLVRRDVEAQYRATGYQIALEPGKRGEAVDRTARIAAPLGGTSRRADWLVLDPKASAPAAADAAPTLPIPALVVPAPAKAPVAAPEAIPPTTPTAPAPSATPAPPPAPRAPAAPPAPPATATDADAMYRNASERLKALQKLRDTGVITEQEYQEKRREILKAL